jgi:hypothetical protein
MQQSPNFPRRSPAIWWVIGGTLLLAGAGFVWHTAANDVTGSTHSSKAQASTGDHERNRAGTHASHNEKKKHSHAVSPALQLEGPEYVEMHSRWFEAPTMATPKRFAATSTPLAVDPSCARRAEMQHPTLESSIRQSIGVDTTQAVPLDALAQQVSQFWQHDGWFYQLSATWEKDIPATYNLQHYRTRQADFRGAVERVPLANADLLDALSMAARIDETLAAAESRGAKRGARLVHLMLGGEEGDSLQDLKISNGKPVAWMFGHGHCRLRTDGAAHCRCIDPATASKEQKKEHSVID